MLKKSQQMVFNELSDVDAGKLIKGIFNYVNYGDSELDGYLKVIFIPIKSDIDENEENYRKRCAINKINGSKGGAPKGNQNAIKGETTENNQSVSKTIENNMNSHISYITNHISDNHNSNNHISDNKDIIKKIIDYLNIKTNSKFKYNTKTTQQKINARLNEGYKLDDFIAVIDKKYDEWVGTEFEMYLCPETLFGTKFEKYLNQKASNKKSKSDKQLDILKGVYNGSIKIN